MRAGFDLSMQHFAETCVDFLISLGDPLASAVRRKLQTKLETNWSARGVAARHTINAIAVQAANWWVRPAQAGT
jgi:hypothetical protein